MVGSAAQVVFAAVDKRGVRYPCSVEVQGHLTRCGGVFSSSTCRGGSLCSRRRAWWSSRLLGRRRRPIYARGEELANSCQSEPAQYQNHSYNSTNDSVDNCWLILPRNLLANYVRSSLQPSTSVVVVTSSGTSSSTHLRTRE